MEKNIIMERGRSKPEWQVKIAKERIAILFDEAKKTNHKDLQKRYVQLARKIGMRYNVRLTSEQKRKFCGHCNAYLGPDVKRRLKSGIITLACPDCKKINRFPYRSFS
jgi:ribonuclease P protein subunit RPR2